MQAKKLIFFGYYVNSVLFFKVYVTLQFLALLDWPGIN